jgi:mono/diheme cytochrome c family protein
MSAVASGRGRRLLLTFTLVGASLLACGAMALVAFVKLNAEPRFSDVARPALPAAMDGSAVARGEYLVHAVAHCTDCHAPKRALGAAGEGELRPALSGGDVIATPFGDFWPSNITPDEETGIGGYSDGDLARVIRHAVNADGGLSPFMKVALGPMADEDLAAIVAYLRSLEPVAREVPSSDVFFIGDALFAFGVFTPAHKMAPPFVGESEKPSVERGRYLAEGPANCVGCHTQADPMNDMAFTNAPFSGGGPHQSAKDPSMVYVPPNLTPHAKHGATSRYDEDAWVARFRQASPYPDSMMPWRNYAQMTDADLRSLYRFLSSLPPVAHDAGPAYRPAD